VDRALGHHDGNGILDFHTGGKSQTKIRKWPPAANCLICLSSSSRGAAGWFLVLGIVSPTTTAPIAALPRSSTHRHKIMSDDAPAKVPFKSDLTLVKGSLHAKAVFERAHACFNARSPALATPKPALFLSRCPAGA
jgi:hypothetical protein